MELSEVRVLLEELAEVGGENVAELDSGFLEVDAHHFGLVCEDVVGGGENGLPEAVLPLLLLQIFNERPIDWLHFSG